MTEARLREIERAARATTLDLKQRDGALEALELVAEVRRLRAELRTCSEAFEGCDRAGHACGCGHAARAVRSVLGVEEMHIEPRTAK